MLDLRTYRDQQVATQLPFPVPQPEPSVDDPDRTILGRQQMEWLKDSLDRKAPQWKIIGNPVMIAPLSLQNLPRDVQVAVNGVLQVLPEDGAPVNVDQWDGYTDDRQEIFQHIANRQIKDAVFITGDIHGAWASDLPFDKSTYPVGENAGVEFVCTSVTSNNLKDEYDTPPRSPVSLAAEAVIMANNRHMRYINFDDHGFSVLDITPERAQMDWFIIGDRADKNTGVEWTQSWRTLSGTSRVQQVDRPVGGR